MSCSSAADPSRWSDSLCQAERFSETQTPVARAAEVKGAAAKDDAVPAWMAASVREIEATQSGERTGLEVAGGQVEAPRGASERTERSATSS